MENATKRAPLSHTEIAMRVKGIIADELVLAAPPADRVELFALPMSAVQFVKILERVRESFGIDLPVIDLAPVRTVGELIDLVEGAVGGIA